MRDSVRLKDTLASASINHEHNQKSYIGIDLREVRALEQICSITLTA